MCISTRGIIQPSTNHHRKLFVFLGRYSVWVSPQPGQLKVAIAPNAKQSKAPHTDRSTGWFLRRACTDRLYVRSVYYFAAHRLSCLVGTWGFFCLVLLIGALVVPISGSEVYLIGVFVSKKKKGNRRKQIVENVSFYNTNNECYQKSC